MMDYHDMLRHVEKAVETLASDESSRHDVAGALTVIRIVVEKRWVPLSEVLKLFEDNGIGELAKTISWLKD
jgi:hypothetical protein